MESEEIEKLKVCGAACLPVDESLVACGLTRPQWDESEEIRAAYRKGYIMTKLKVRQTVAKLAAEGDPAMVKIYVGFEKESAADEPEVLNVQDAGNAQTKLGGYEDL